MSRLFAPLTSKLRREKQAKQRSLDSDSNEPAPITKSSSLSNDIKEKASLSANAPYYHATTNTRPTTPTPVSENINVPVLHPVTPPQSPGTEPRPDTPSPNPELARGIAPIDNASEVSNASHSCSPASPAPPPVLEAVQQPLYALKEAAAREPDLVDQDPSSEFEHLSTAELRTQWEDQEIERFLRVFSRVGSCLPDPVQDINIYLANSKSTKCVFLQIFPLSRERLVRERIPTYWRSLRKMSMRISTL